MFGKKKADANTLSEHGGVVAWATVLDAETRWTSGSNNENGPYTVGNVNHMKVTLHVEPDGQPPFDVTFHQAFPGNIPMKGWRAKVTYDANDHSQIVIQDNQIFPPGSQGGVAITVDGKTTDAADLSKLFTGGVSAKPDVTEELSRLAELRDRGVLTEAEFEAQKAKLLAAS
jgi:hypothetical protein